VYSKIPTTVNIGDPELTQSNGILTLRQNYPNPFFSSTSISYELTSPAVIKMSVYDINGKLVDILKEEHQAAGEYTFLWYGSNSRGESLKTGVYLLVAEVHAEGQIYRQTKEMIRQ
jgi:flagellar hook assembly protein FlgD